MMKRHAYMIMAHNEFLILEKLIKSLDCDSVDIYLHVDKKVKDFPFTYFSNLVKKSKIYFVKRIKVNWGGDSQIKCELNLLKEAIKGDYDYYHLLSGVDMPLTNIEKINGFFENSTFSYIKRNNEVSADELKGIKHYYYFQDLVGRGKSFKEKFFKVIQRGIVVIEKLLRINRIKDKELNYIKSDQWFSIKKDLANYILANEEFLKKHFYHSYLADELAIATLAYNSPYKEQIVNDSLRYIDWDRGKPYTFTLSDYDLLISSPKLFARKFSSKDLAIVDKLFSYLGGK